MSSVRGSYARLPTLPDFDRHAAASENSHESLLAIPTVNPNQPREWLRINQRGHLKFVLVRLHPLRFFSAPVQASAPKLSSLCRWTSMNSSPGLAFITGKKRYKQICQKSWCNPWPPFFFLQRLAHCGPSHSHSVPHGALHQGAGYGSQL